MTRKTCYIVLLLVNLITLGFSQVVKSPFYLLETGGTASVGQQNPFWIVNNHFGKTSAQKTSAFLAAALQSNPDTSKVLDYNYGLQLFERFDGENALWIHEAYFKVRYRSFILGIGKEEETYGNQDNSISSGSLLWSGNTRPMPEIVLKTDGYVSVPYTKGYIELSGLLSHGWFGNDGYVKKTYLHHKYLYVRLGGKLPVNFSVGLQHYAMWGGVSPDTVYGKLPTGWDTYKRIFLADQGDPDDPGTPDDEALNRLGNHLGSKNYRIDVKLKTVSFGMYYQTIFEDNSGYKKYFMRDGLWGICMERTRGSYWIDKLLYERIQTTYQSGGIQHAPDGSTFVDNYFNHYLYRSGWTYHGNTIGTPLITSPVFNKDGSISIVNNRVIAHHLGIQGTITDGLNYRILFTASTNKGTFPLPFAGNEKVQSFFIELNKSWQKYKGVTVTLQAGADQGKLYGNNAGMLVKISKRGVF